MSDRSLFRWGGLAAVAGAVLAIVFNLLHPRISQFDDPVVPELEAVSGSDAWVGIHLGILLASLLIFFGLFALARSVKGSPGEGLGRVAGEQEGDKQVRTKALIVGLMAAFM